MSIRSAPGEQPGQNYGEELRLQTEHAPYDHCTVNFLEQAGVRPTWIKLTQIGIHGNGHNMMLEKNNMEIASILSQWLAKTVPGNGDQHNTSAVAPD